MRGQDRCGAECICVRKGNVIGLEILSLITEIQIFEGQRVSLPADLSIGEFIPIDHLFREHRGLVIKDQNGGSIDEGEVWPVAASFEFDSDYDFEEAPRPSRTIESLLGFSIEIKWEIFDQLGAARRLREFQKQNR